MRGLFIGILAGWGAATVVAISAPSAQNASCERLEYGISWKGLPVGTAVVVNDGPASGRQGKVTRSIKVVSRPWLKLLHPVRDEIECVRDGAGSRVRYSVHKVINEAGFHQDDVLTVDGVTGMAVWIDSRHAKEVRYPVPDQVRDYLSFLFDLRFDVFPLGGQREYSLAMDDGVRRLSITGSCTGMVDCAWGRVPARKLEIKSLSSQLFVRNVPRAVWIAEEHPVVIEMEASTKLGVVRAVLQKWVTDGQDVVWHGAPPRFLQAR